MVQDSVTPRLAGFVGVGGQRERAEKSGLGVSHRMQIECP
jgi:hypothetical protein